MLWGTLPELVQVHVTVPPTATVTTAGLLDPLSPLLKKMLPTVTAAVLGAAPPPVAPPVPPPVEPPPVEGAVGELPEHPASTARVIARRKCRIMRSPVLNAIVVRSVRAQPGCDGTL